MAISAIVAEKVLPYIIGSSKIVTILSILVAVIVYLLSLILMKVFREEDYQMLPYGTKIYKFFQKVKLVK